MISSSTSETTIPRDFVEAGFEIDDIDALDWPIRKLE